MTAFYAATFIRQRGELFTCLEDYHAENPNIFHHYEMLDFLKRTFVKKGAWRSSSGKRLDFGKFTSKKVAELMIEGLGFVDELGIEGEMPMYLRLLPLMKKGLFSWDIAEKLINDNQIQAVVSRQDPLFKSRLDLLGKKCAKSLLLFINHANEAVPMRMFTV